MFVYKQPDPDPENTRLETFLLLLIFTNNFLSKLIHYVITAKLTTVKCSVVTRIHVTGHERLRYLKLEQIEQSNEPATLFNKIQHHLKYHRSKSPASANLIQNVPFKTQ